MPSTATDVLAARTCRCRLGTWTRERDRDCPACIGKPVRDACDVCGQWVDPVGRFAVVTEVVPPPPGFRDYFTRISGHKKCVDG